MYCLDLYQQLVPMTFFLSQMDDNKSFVSVLVWLAFTFLRKKLVFWFDITSRSCVYKKCSLLVWMITLKVKMKPF